MKCPHCKKEINLKELKLRSVSENKYYWGVVLDILSDELGHTKTEMHEILKTKFLRDIAYIKKKNGEHLKVETSKSTTDLKTNEFEDYLSKIRNFASAELGIWIPEPNEEK